MGFWTLVRRGQRQIGKQSHPSDLPGGYFLPALAIPASLETPAHGEEEASWSESWFIFCLQGTCAQQHMVSVDLCTQMSEQGKQWANIILEAKASIHAAFAQKNSSAVSQEGLSTATRLLRWQRLNCAGAFKPCLFLLADNANCHYQ